MTHVMTPEILARQTSIPIKVWRDAEITLGPELWSLLWRDVVTLCAKTLLSPSAVAAAIVSAMEQESIKPDPLGG